MKVRYIQELQKWAGELDNVFTISDLKVMLNQDAPATLFRMIDEFVANGLLVRVKRGVYATPEASLEAISFRIDPGAYVSLGTVLARRLAIGSVPVRKLQAIKLGRSRIYEFEQGTIEHLGIAPPFYFGFERTQEAPLVATLEKAFLDVCYFSYKGKSFGFDPASDINLDLLNRDAVRQYLINYDERFRTYVKRIWGMGDD